MRTDVIKYKVTMEDQYHRQEFTFVHRVPLALQQEMSNLSAIEDLITDLKQKYHQELVEAHPWCPCNLPRSSAFFLYPYDQ